jgi:hypothetical protein
MRDWSRARGLSLSLPESGRTCTADGGAGDNDQRTWEPQHPQGGVCRECDRNVDGSVDGGAPERIVEGSEDQSDHSGGHASEGPLQGGVAAERMKGARTDPSAIRMPGRKSAHRAHKALAMVSRREDEGLLAPR